MPHLDLVDDEADPLVQADVREIADAVDPSVRAGAALGAEPVAAETERPPIPLAAVALVDRHQLPMPLEIGAERRKHVVAEGFVTHHRYQSPPLRIASPA